MWNQILGKLAGSLKTGVVATVRGARHRPPGAVEQALIRRVHPRGGVAITPSENPGVLLEPAFCSPAEASAAVAVGLEVIKRYSSSHVIERHRQVYDAQMAHLASAPPVNMRRVTGRDESAAWIEEAQTKAPWGYGDAFKPDQLPAPLRVLSERIASHPSFALGPLRDVTLNYRTEGYFRLDPHVDPKDDGANVFILGFLSSTVLSLSKVGPREAGLLDQRKVASKSWSSAVGLGHEDADLDVLLPPRCLLHLSGDARWKWHHGVRLGVDKRELKRLGVDVARGSSSGGDSSGGSGSEESRGAVVELLALAEYECLVESLSPQIRTTTMAASSSSKSSNGCSFQGSSKMPPGGGAMEESELTTTVEQVANNSDDKTLGHRNADLYDWWGSVHRPVQRTPARLSVIFAFASSDTDGVAN